MCSLFQPIMCYYPRYKPQIQMGISVLPMAVISFWMLLQMLTWHTVKSHLKAISHMHRDTGMSFLFTEIS